MEEIRFASLWSVISDRELNGLVMPKRNEELGSGILGSLEHSTEILIIGLVSFTPAFFLRGLNTV